MVKVILQNGRVYQVIDTSTDENDDYAIAEYNRLKRNYPWFHWDISSREWVHDPLAHRRRK